MLEVAVVSFTTFFATDRPPQIALAFAALTSSTNLRRGALQR